MQQQKARAVADQLSRWGLPAAFIADGRSDGGIRISLPDGAEARWGIENSQDVRGLMLKGDSLVGCTPPIPGGEELSAMLIAWEIAHADYERARSAGTPAPGLTA